MLTVSWISNIKFNGLAWERAWYGKTVLIYSSSHALCGFRVCLCGNVCCCVCVVCVCVCMEAVVWGWAFSEPRWNSVVFEALASSLWFLLPSRCVRAGLSERSFLSERCQPRGGHWSPEHTSFSQACTSDVVEEEWQSAARRGRVELRRPPLHTNRIIVCTLQVLTSQMRSQLKCGSLGAGKDLNSWQTWETH